MLSIRVWVSRSREIREGRLPKFGNLRKSCAGNDCKVLPAFDLAIQFGGRGRFLDMHSLPEFTIVLFRCPT